jgi:hypothetical protein
MADISQLLRSSGVNLERTTTQLFGNAVEDFARGKLAGTILDPARQNSAPVNRNDGTWYATSYAAGLANTSYRPKLKFLFKVEFLFRQTPDVQQFLNANRVNPNFTFLIATVDRPKVDFEYEEVNQYNFRTRVLKQIKHREMTMTFLDDVGNNVFEFFRFMMMVHSPITRQSVKNAKTLAEVYANYGAGSGMTFSEGIASSSAQHDYAHRGVLQQGFTSIIQAIRVAQVFVDPTTQLDTATHSVAFDFINPRLVSFDLNDLAHDSSDPVMMTMQFDYDFLTMTNLGVQVDPPGPRFPAPGARGAPLDLTPTGRGSGSKPAGGADPYTSILSAIGGRAAQKITSDTIGRLTRQVPGLGFVGEALGGLTQGLARDAITGFGSTVSQSWARPRAPVVSGGTATDVSYTPSSGAYSLTTPGATGVGGGGGE